MGGQSCTKRGENAPHTPSPRFTDFPNSLFWKKEPPEVIRQESWFFRAATSTGLENRRPRLGSPGSRESQLRVAGTWPPLSLAREF